MIDRILSRTCLAVLLLMGLQGFARGDAHFTMTLDGSQEDPPVASSAIGTGSFALTSEGLHYFLTVQGLSTSITGAHFHLGARGASGGVLRDITTQFGLDGTAIGLWSPTDAQPLDAAAIAALMRGDLYVNVHTIAHPAGEVRGQVDLSSGSFFRANLTGNQEEPPIAVAGRGTGSFHLDVEGRALAYRITATDLTGGITAAHIHTGAIGVNGGIAVDLTSSFVGNTAVGTWSGLTDDQIRQLMAGNLYCNIHTAAHPAGEVRGQILLSAGFGFSAGIDGGQEVPPVATAGQGSASFTLTPEGLQFDVTVSGLTGPITAAHFHHAPSGANGTVVRDVTSDFGGGTTASGIWKPDDAQPLTRAMICALLSGEIYLNVHTAMHPAGEIRGQVNLSVDETTLTATLTGDEEEPAVPGSGRGTGSFRISPAGLEYWITVDGLTGPITAAHIHSAPIGTNGGIVIDLTADFGGSNTAIGSQPLAPGDVTNLLLGNLYVNVHTAAHPAGEIRGQITLASGTGVDATMTPEQETGTVVGSMTGTASMTLTDAGLAFTATVDDLTGAITGSHFHNAGTGSDGGVVRDITSSFTGKHAEGVWKPGDAAPLTEALATELLLGRIYVNVHTATHPAGELRGQALLSEGFPFATVLHGGNEVPAVSTRGTGTLAATLSDAGFIYTSTTDRLSGPITAAHFHNAPPGANGAIALDITSRVLGSTASGVWRPNDTTPLTPGMICEVLDGAIYLNFHTANHPAGEIRGNLGERTAASVDDPATLGTSTLLLLQNHPNPFGGQTALSYRLTEDSFVRLKVYDVGGAEVATLVEGQQRAGFHHVSFDSGRLPSGVYLYRLEAQGHVATRKMLLRK